MTNTVKEVDINYIVHGDKTKAQELILSIGNAAQKIVGVVTNPNNV